MRKELTMTEKKYFGLIRSYAFFVCIFFLAMQSIFAYSQENISVQTPISTNESTQIPISDIKREPSQSPAQSSEAKSDYEKSNYDIFKNDLYVELLSKIPEFQTNNTVMVFCIDGSGSMKTSYSGTDLFLISRDLIRDFVKENVIFEDEVIIFRFGPTATFFRGNKNIINDSNLQSLLENSSDFQTSNPIPVDKKLAFDEIGKITWLPSQIPEITDTREYSDIDLAKYIGLDIVDYYKSKDAKKNILFLVFTDNFNQPIEWGNKKENLSLMEKKLDELKLDYYGYFKTLPTKNLVVYYGYKSLNTVPIAGYQVGKNTLRKRNDIVKYINSEDPMVLFKPSLNIKTGESLDYYIDIYDVVSQNGEETGNLRESFKVDKEQTIKKRFKSGKYAFLVSRDGFKQQQTDLTINEGDGPINFEPRLTPVIPVWIGVMTVICIFFMVIVAAVMLSKKKKM